MLFRGAYTHTMLDNSVAFPEEWEINSNLNWGWYLLQEQNKYITVCIMPYIEHAKKKDLIQMYGLEESHLIDYGRAEIIANKYFRLPDAFLTYLEKKKECQPVQLTWFGLCEDRMELWECKEFNSFYMDVCTMENSGALLDDLPF